ncbi:hypothetical protein [Arcobacter porcinus]|uniref:hypothetical protein n=1 Tax=Arcobacter porcinus TaxID=1935204 RepID=UPI0008249DF1|nr:hypothetical protein [Arcobacter porcinus]OCL87283.1 hypothetical protein AAX30_01052 [Arcobacter porcinus]
MKKTLAISLAFMVFFSGCYTKQNINHTYIDEKIDSFMMKEDDKSFIILGEKYHYIFKPNNKFEYLLKNLNEEYKFDIENSYYWTENDIANAKISIIINKNNSSKEFINWALNNGAVPYSNDNSLILKILLEGHFYLPNPEITSAIPKLDEVYNIKVKQINLTNVTITPIHIVGGVVMIAGFIVIAIPIMIIMVLKGDSFN